MYSTISINEHTYRFKHTSVITTTFWQFFKSGRYALGLLVTYLVYIVDDVKRISLFVLLYTIVIICAYYVYLAFLQIKFSISKPESTISTPHC